MYQVLQMKTSLLWMWAEMMGDFVSHVSFSPAEVAHAGSHLHLPTVDVHAPAHTLHAFDWHGTGQGALTLHC